MSGALVQTLEHATQAFNSTKRIPSKHGGQPRARPSVMDAHAARTPVANAYHSCHKTLSDLARARYIPVLKDTIKQFEDRNEYCPVRSC
jgi:hypothetical protein